MSSVDWKVFFNSGTASFNSYKNGDSVSLIEITNSDQDYYQNGMLSIYNLRSSQTIGDEVTIYINDTIQFDGYISRVERTIKQGILFYNFQLVGKTYDLWRYHTDSDASYNGKTAYIAKQLIDNYATNVNSNYIDVNNGETLSEEIDLTNITVGDALIKLTEYDGYKFYVDSDDELQYYEPGTETSTFTIEESDILDMSSIEEADEDIVNDVLVVGATGYQTKTEVSTSHPSSTIFPSGPNYLAQQFRADNHILSAIDLYLDRSVDPNRPDSLELLGIWGNTSYDLFEDTFDNYNYLNQDTSWGMEVYRGYLQLGSEKIDIAYSYPFNTPITYNDKLITKGFANRKAKDVVLDCIVIVPGSSEKGETLTITIVPSSTSAGSQLPDVTTRYVSASAFISEADDKIGYKYNFYFKSGGRKANFILESGQVYYFVINDKWDISLDTDNQNLVYVRGGGGSYSYNDDDNNYYLSRTTDDWVLTASNMVNFHISTQWYSGSGYIESKNYDDIDTQYLKLTLSGAVSSNNIKISGTNSGSANWQTLTDSEWYNFDFPFNSGTRVKYVFSGNHSFSPLIDAATLSTSDETGSFDADVFTEDFSDLTDMSSQSKVNMVVDDLAYDEYLALSGSVTNTVTGLGSSYWRYADSISTNLPWSDIDNARTTDQDYAFLEPSYTYGDGYWILGFDSPKTIDAWRIGRRLQGGYCIIKEIYISTTKVGAGWQLTKTASPALHLEGSYSHYDSAHHLTNGTYVVAWNSYDSEERAWSGVKKVKFNMEHNGGSDYHIKWWSFRERSYPNKGRIKTKTYDVASNVDMTSLIIQPSDVTYPLNITYSGSLDEGKNFEKIEPNNFTQLSNPGRKVVVGIYMTPSGSWPTGYSSNTMLPASPRIGSLEVDASIIRGGGIPKSGSDYRIRYADDLTWTYRDTLYPPQWSGWKTYSSPKLSGLTIGNSYWMIFTYPSGNGKYWKYYYDPKSTYIYGKMAYSTDRGVTWNILYGSGNMSFKLGWLQGEATATATNDTSIGLYGRHFKKITDSTITSTDQAQNRADREVEGMEVIPKKGNITIVGRTALSVDYRFSANLTHHDINGVFDIVSYTQRIDNQGFTSTIDFGKHPYDIAKEVQNLKSQVGED